MSCTFAYATGRLKSRAILAEVVPFSTVFAIVSASEIFVEWLSGSSDGGPWWLSDLGVSFGELAIYGILILSLCE